MKLSLSVINIGCLSNDDSESNGNVPSYQNEMRFFFFFFFLTFPRLFLSTLLKWQIKLNLPRSLGDRTQGNWFCSWVNVLQTSLQNELFGPVRTGCKEKRTGRSKFVVFHLLIGLGYESERILVKTPAIFSLVRYLCTWIFENQASKKINVNSFYYLAV